MGALYHDVECLDESVGDGTAAEFVEPGTTPEPEDVEWTAGDGDGDDKPNTMLPMILVGALIVVLLIGAAAVGVMMFRKGDSSPQSQSKVIALPDRTNEDLPEVPSAN